jgi:putative zinc finger protein
MRPGCDAPIRDERLIDYWAGDLGADEAGSIEEHLFACGDCASRLEAVASIGTGVATLVRKGSVSGIISRALLNRMQRDGVHIRMYSLLPAETVPCAVFPGDDLVVATLRADLSSVHAVTISVTGPGDAPMGEVAEAPVSAQDGEVLWATPGALVRQMPSIRLRLRLMAAGDPQRVLGEYVLDHAASEPPI